MKNRRWRLALFAASAVLAVTSPGRAATPVSDAPVTVSEALAKGKAANAAKDPKEARKWFRAAAEQGDAESEYLLADNLYELASVIGLNGALAKKDTDVDTDSEQKEALDWAQKSAAQGYAKAETLLGHVFSTGEVYGSEPDETLAVSWYRKAAEQGDAEGQYYLGKLLEEGKGVSADKKEASVWYEKAAAQGHVEAKQSAWRLKQEAEPGKVGQPGREALEKAKEADKSSAGRKDADKWYRVAADQGNAEAQNALGSRILGNTYAGMFARGLKDVNYDPDPKKEPGVQEGLRWIRKSAEQGFAEAEYYLGTVYERGDAVDQDTDQARKWYEKAAAQGHVKAQEALKTLK